MSLFVRPKARIAGTGYVTPPHTSPPGTPPAVRYKENNVFDETVRLINEFNRCVESMITSDDNLAISSQQSREVSPNQDAFDDNASNEGQPVNWLSRRKKENSDLKGKTESSVGCMSNELNAALTRTFNTHTIVETFVNKNQNAPAQSFQEESSESWEECLKKYNALMNALDHLIKSQGSAAVAAELSRCGQLRRSNTESFRQVLGQLRNRVQIVMNLLKQIGRDGTIQSNP